MSEAIQTYPSQEQDARALRRLKRFAGRSCRDLTYRRRSRFASRKAVLRATPLVKGNVVGPNDSLK